jgi:peptide/nickel transport system permease protein
MRIVRVLGVVPTAIMAATLAFVLLRVLPGDPVTLLLGMEAPPQEASVLRHSLGLDRPLWEQYVAWLLDLLRGRLGTSLSYHVPVATLVAERLPVTCSLAAASLALTVVVALPLGVLTAARAWSPVDVGVLAVTQAGLAVPSFWVGILLLLLFSVVLGWLPLQGYAPLGQGPWEWARHLLLPSGALAAARAAQLTRFVRAAVLEELGRDYVRAARGKGLGERSILLRHALRNALIPTVTVAGLQFGYLLGGAIVVEQVFGLPGMGRLVVQGIYARDLPLVQAAVAVLAVLVCAVNALVDLCYRIMDPRLDA